MTDNYINVTVTSKENKRVTVSTQEPGFEVTATTDTGKFWAQTAENWATSDTIVENKDYSSKYYANKAKVNAENARVYEASVKETYNSLIAESNSISNEIRTTGNEVIDNINSTKTNILKDIEFVADGEKEEIQELADKAKDDIESTGFYMRDDKLYFINSEGKEEEFKSGGLDDKITNCLTEIPQRIKYTLEDGTLTIKAGSVVIVPYGVEDLTSDYPVGSVFINDNFKVYDTQFIDDKFFVWAEIQNDIQDSTETTVEEKRQRIVCLEFTSSGVLSGVINHNSGEGSFTETTNCYRYRTDINLMERYSAGVSDADKIISLPFGTISSMKPHYWSSVDQVFNGMGYIGSTIWVDKGVKGLACNGRNEDGSLKNIEFTTRKLYLETAPNATYTANFGYDPVNDAFSLRNEVTWTYDERENIFIWATDNSKISMCYTSRVEITNGVISNFQPKQPFHAVDHSELQEVQVVIETYQSGTSWYRVWSDGWKEQGGQSSSSSAGVAVTFLKPFSNTNYTVQATNITNNHSDNSTGCQKVSKSQIKLFNSNARNHSWYACGY